MKVTTLGAWLDAFKPLSTWTLIKAKLKSELGADATVLLPDECPDCVGVDAHEGECQRCHGSGEISRSVGAADFMDECPNCDGTGRGAWTPCGKRKAVIVPKEQWEAFEDVCRDEWVTLTDECGKRFNRATAAIATALLGGKVYRAKEVGTWHSFFPRTVTVGRIENEHGVSLVPQAGDLIAILEKEDTNA